MNTYSLPFILILLTCGIIPSDAVSQVDPNKVLENFKGHWRYETSENVYHEIWQDMGSNGLRGSGSVMRRSDTLFTEDLSVVNLLGTYCYIARPQNEKHTKFYLTAFDDTSVTFENGQHDFPKMIKYTIVGPDELKAVISGLQNDTTITRAFHYQRVKK